MMNNVVRFFLGLFLSVLMLIIAIGVVVLLLPVIVVSGLIVLVLFIIGVLILVALFVLSFIWFVMRKEPPKGKSTSYSLSQGRKVK